MKGQTSRLSETFPDGFWELVEAVERLAGETATFVSFFWELFVSRFLGNTYLKFTVFLVTLT